MSREELIYDEDYSEQEAEIMLLKSKLEKANEKIEDYEYSIKAVKEMLEKTIKINQRCMLEKLDSAIYTMLKMETERNIEILGWLTFEE